VHRLEDDLPPYRADLTRPDRHRAGRRRGRRRGRLVQRVRPGEQPHNLRHRHHPPNAGASMSVPHVAPRGKTRRNPTPPSGRFTSLGGVRTSCGAATPGGWVMVPTGSRAAVPRPRRTGLRLAAVVMSKAQVVANSGTSAPPSGSILLYRPLSQRTPCSAMYLSRSSSHTGPESSRASRARSHGV
jgi:hypothetical protein